MTPEPILCAEQIVKTFPFPSVSPVLQGVDLSVYPGDTVAITGASGEGKSTLLHILGTLEAPSSGSLLLGGKTVTIRRAPAMRNQLVGFVFQSFYLMEDCTVLDNVLMPARIARRNCSPHSPARQRALELLHQVGLDNRTRYPVKLLSGGEKQRTALARALINDPPILLADEPSGNLDRMNAEIIYQLIFKLVEHGGKTLITVTHDERLASRCQRQYLLRDGRLHVVKQPHLDQNGLN